MVEEIDVTLDSDDDKDLQEAIRASLSTSNGGSASRSADTCLSAARRSRCDTDTAASAETCTAQSSNRGKRRRSHDSQKRCTDSPPLFRLLSTSAADTGGSSGSVALEDLLSGEFEEALLSNYMIDMGLMVQAQPRLACVPVIVVHGDKQDSIAEHNLRMQCADINPGIRLHRPEIPTYGTHHSKMMILKFSKGVRVVILTANFVSTDVADKSQGVWYQEFPLREAGTCDFEETLVDYLKRVGGPATVFGRTLRRYDFRSARVALIPSVPGTGKNQHKGADLHKFGHMRVRALLSQEKMSLERGRHRVVFQFSSLASLTDTPNQWLTELLTSFMEQRLANGGGRESTKEDNGQPEDLLEEHLRLIWPSVEAVRNSAKGWESGGSICCNTENMFGGRYQRPDMARYRSNRPRAELIRLLHKWEGNATVNRVNDAPHIKTYLRYRELDTDKGQRDRVDGDEVAWFLLTSSNLSRSAWGFLDKKTSKQLTLKSFELGVMFLPSLLDDTQERDSSQQQQPAKKHKGNRQLDSAEKDTDVFSCTPVGETGLPERFPLAWRRVREAGDKGLPLKLLPLPYRLPASPYDFGKNDDAERPWVWDREYTARDRTGRTWPFT